MLTSDTANRRVVVTGSSGEIGLNLAAHFAAAGWTVVALDGRPPDRGALGLTLAAHSAAAGWTVCALDVRPPDGDRPSNVIAATCDIAEGAAAAAALGDLSARHGAPDVLVNCAGLIANSPLLKRGAAGWEVHDFALWDAVIAASLTSAFHATAICAKLMLEARRRGVVVNISSVCARGNPGQVAYSAAKAGLNGLTLALAKELGPLGIRVVGLAPGYFDTASTARNVSEARMAKVTAAVPLKRLGRVSEIAEAIDFIVANQYINGTIVELDGGLVV